jgi:hypothetical protein
MHTFVFINHLLGFVILAHAQQRVNHVGLDVQVAARYRRVVGQQVLRTYMDTVVCYTGPDNPKVGLSLVTPSYREDFDGLLVSAQLSKTHAHASPCIHIRPRLRLYWY